MLCQTRIELQVVFGTTSRDACAPRGNCRGPIDNANAEAAPLPILLTMRQPRSLTRLVESPSRYEPHFDHGYNSLGKSP